MGIPFYFSYIVKNHPSILKRISEVGGVDNLFLDCNSIVYDAVHSLKLEEGETPDASILRVVIEKIDEYIRIVAPKNLAFVAFDGVAPVAKLSQQRERRYKSQYQSRIAKTIHKRVEADPFNTTAITPGTPFMCELNRRLKSHYGSKKANVIVSDSDEVGEGEHKLFAFLRESERVSADSVNLVYGLDADLIMLSMNHLPIKPRIYLFRETPEFIRSLDSTLDPGEHYYLDIPELAATIESDTGLHVYDYIFLCFFLGNDFLPHFPAINIRTGGVDKMLQAYTTINEGKKEKVRLFENGIIQWSHARDIVGFLATNEELFIKEEVKLRDKRERRFWPERTPEEIMTKFENIPTHERELEKFVNPREPGWQKRYYQAFFLNDVNIDAVCINYLEGLEWTMKYYTEGCVDWRWSYRYNYPPLLQDLIRFMPLFDKEFIQKKAPNPVTPVVQLSYVLPRSSLYMLPPKVKAVLLKEHSEWYPEDCDYYWAFCKYFWESHANLPEIDVDQLEKVVKGVVS